MRWLGAKFNCAICQAEGDLPEEAATDRPYVCFDCAWLFRHILYIHVGENADGQQCFWLDESRPGEDIDPLEP